MRFWAGVLDNLELEDQTPKELWNEFQNCSGLSLSEVDEVQGSILKGPDERGSSPEVPALQVDSEVVKTLAVWVENECRYQNKGLVRWQSIWILKCSVPEFRVLNLD